MKTYVSPSDIAFLKKGDKVKLQIDAFDYNQWGLATGTITKIANDVQLIDNSPLFRVECSLDQQSLKVKNGFEGGIEKRNDAYCSF